MTNPLASFPLDSIILVHQKHLSKPKITAYIGRELRKTLLNLAQL